MQQNEVSGNLVLSLIQNQPESLMGYLALLKSEAVQMLQSEHIIESVLSDLVHRFEPNFIWLPTERSSELPLYKKCIEVGSYCLCVNHAFNTKIHPDLAILLSTSGSTGSSKFVRISKRNLLENAKAISQYLDITSDEKPITTLPPSYTYGLSIIHSHILAGSAIIVSDKSLFDRSFWQLFNKSGATSFGGVPFHYEMLKKLKFSEMELPSLRTITQAGGRMDPGLIREFADICSRSGVRFFPMYGQVEATSRISFLDPSKISKKADSIGQAIPGGKLWLQDESGAILESPQEAGELIFEGPNVCMGYATGHEDLSKPDLNCGVLATGDIAKMDEDGDFYIVGRKNRFLKLFGHRVNLNEVEIFLQKDGFVTACSGQDDHLEIFLEGADLEELRNVRRSATKFLKLSNKACSAYTIPQFPRTTSGKIKYSDLQSNDKE
ncbi:MAG: AMP-dependent synthetase [Flavobacteriaceae bacterium]|nr:AMP-dependent synthetase [Flavobacteriaceae bacterium]